MIELVKAIDIVTDFLRDHPEIRADDVETFNELAITVVVLTEKAGLGEYLPKQADLVRELALPGEPDCVEFLSQLNLPGNWGEVEEFAVDNDESPQMVGAFINELPRRWTDTIKTLRRLAEGAPSVETAATGKPKGKRGRKPIPLSEKKAIVDEFIRGEHGGTARVADHTRVLAKEAPRSN